MIVLGTNHPTDWLARASGWCNQLTRYLVAFPDQSDPPRVQRALARGILRGHLICLAAVISLLVVQLTGA